MPRLALSVSLSFCAVLLGLPCAARAQIVESVGSRALGMGGAFVAVATDSSATWWNPGALADGPYVDLALAKATTERAETVPAQRDRASWFALGTPPFGISYYRLKVTDIRSTDSTDAGTGNRDPRQVEMPVRSWSASQLGITLVQTLVPGVHAGTTIKYVRGTLRSSPDPGPGSPSERLDRGDRLEGGGADHRFDADLGVLAVAGPVRLGGVVRNVRAPQFGGEGFRLPRQVRGGAALDVQKSGGPPLVVAVDADLREYATASGQRRVVAVGAEQWLWARRIGIRGGARLNTVGAEERSATGGLSVAVRSGTYVDAFIIRGGSLDERGWGVATRVSF